MIDGCTIMICHTAELIATVIVLIKINQKHLLKKQKTNEIMDKSNFFLIFMKYYIKILVNDR